MNFSQNTIDFLNKEFPDIDQKTISEMDLTTLQHLRDKVIEKRQEYSLIELSYKTCANAAYGSCGNEHFYFYDVDLAASITAECYALTSFFWERLSTFLKEDIWNMPELQKRLDIELDESRHDWIREQTLSHQADTDSVYTSYGPLFECFTEECKQKYATDEAKVRWLLRFYKEFMDGQQYQWCEELYNKRHGHNVHEFELELICKASISIVKKKYVKGVAFEKGHFMIDNPKLKSTGVEIVKSTTPSICRRFLKDIVNDLLYKYDDAHREEFIYMLNEKLRRYYAEFHAAPIDDIAQSVGVGDYRRYVIDDTDNLEFEKGCPFSVKAAARYNYLANKNGRSDLRIMSGKIKYYNIRVGQNTCFFGFPYGECPSFAPPVDYTKQWEKTVIDPLNRFMTAMRLPNIGPTNNIQMTLFD